MPSSSLSAVIYARISADRDGTAVGVERQVAACKEYIAEQGWTLAAEYVDNNQSAMSGRRPQYRRMLEELAGIDVVVVWSSDRLYRRMKDLEELVDRLGRVRVVALKSGDIDLGTADGRGIARILGSVAQRESEKTAERVEAAARQRAVEGRHHGGPKVFGFNPDGTPNGPELEIVRAAISRLDDGESLRSVMADMPMESSIQLKRVIRNPRLVGMRTYRGSVVEGTGKPLVDTEAWNRVSQRFAATGKGRPPTTLLSGIASCGVCGGWVRAHTRSRDGVQEAAYRCFDRRCVSRGREQTDRYVGLKVVELLESERDRIAAAVRTPGPVDELAPLRAELAALADLFAAGRMSAAAYAAAATRTEERIRAAVSQRESVPGEGVQGLLASGDAAGAWRGAPVGVRRQVLRVLAARITVPRGRGPVLVEWIHEWSP